jgi:hypothetical protein
MIKALLRWIFGVLTFLFVLAIVLFSPVDDDPIEEKPFYKNTLARLDTFQFSNRKASSQTKTAWFKVNITPSSPMPMAGYAPRNHFDAVHDSVFIRGLVISNGNTRIYFISADLLIFPPSLKEKIITKYQPQHAQYYFMASHAHSSLGTWDDSVVGNLILGSYNDDYWNQVTENIISNLKDAEQHLIDSKIFYVEPDAKEFVENRLDYQQGAVDGKIRSIKIIRSDSTKALWMTFSAHPTNISHLSLTLSGDYPNALIKRAEQDVDFAMFGTGMVGSHRAKGMEKKEFEMCDELAEKLYTKIKVAPQIQLKDSISMSMASIPLEYGKSQMHVFQNFVVRDWAFNGLLRPLQGNITYCKLGPILFLGTPCDFSGEIFIEEKLGEFAESQGEKLFITSFNGDYTGYISDDKYYGHTEQEEVMALNWVGPHFGMYYTDVIKKIITKSK